MFLDQTPGTIEKLKQSINKQETNLIREEAHYLKGSGLGIGANQVAKICETIQRKAEDNDLSDMESLIVQLEQNYEQAVRELEKWIE